MTIQEGKKEFLTGKVPGYTQNTVRGGKTDLTVEDQNKVSGYSITKSWCQYKGTQGWGYWLNGPSRIFSGMIRHRLEKSGG